MYMFSILYTHSSETLNRTLYFPLEPVKKHEKSVSIVKQFLGITQRRYWNKLFYIAVYMQSIKPFVELFNIRLRTFHEDLVFQYCHPPPIVHSCIHVSNLSRYPYSQKMLIQIDTRAVFKLYSDVDTRHDPLLKGWPYIIILDILQFCVYL